MDDTFFVQQADGLPNLAVLYGMSGCGKSFVARQYGKLQREKYGPNIFFIQANTATSLTQAYVKIYSSPTISPKKKEKKLPLTDTASIIVAVKTWFLEEVEGRWLIVFDNVTIDSNLEDFIPYGKLSQQGDIIITCINKADFGHIQKKYQKLGHRMGTVKSKEVKKFTDDEAVLLTQYNLKQEKQDSEANTRLFVRKLECIPLLVAHACKFINLKDGFTLTRFMSDYEQVILEVMDGEDVNLTPDDHQPFKTTFRMILERIRVDYPIAYLILNIIFLMNPKNISYNLILSYLSLEGIVDIATIDGQLGILINNWLVFPIESGADLNSTFYMHESVHSVCNILLNYTAGYFILDTKETYRHYVCALTDISNLSAITVINRRVDKYLELICRIDNMETLLKRVLKFKEKSWLKERLYMDWIFPLMKSLAELYCKIDCGDQGEKLRNLSEQMKSYLEEFYGDARSPEIGLAYLYRAQSVKAAAPKDYDYDQVKTDIDQALTLLVQDKQRYFWEIARCYLVLSGISAMRFNYDSLKSCCEEGIKILTEEGCTSEEKPFLITLSQLYNNLASYYLKVKDYEEADENYKNALQCASYDPKAHCTYGLFLFGVKKDIAVALDHFRQCLAGITDNPDFFYYFTGDHALFFDEKFKKIFMQPGSEVIKLDPMVLCHYMITYCLMQLKNDYDEVKTKKLNFDKCYEKTIVRFSPDSQDFQSHNLMKECLEEHFEEYRESLSNCPRRVVY